ncbi:MAG: hypothetical protein ACLFNA_08925 [Halochromatium sp.]|uniref:hypothetical protein n=1 Tax=Halochromatium sp. TaxID=2049430 RepID=UPI0039797DFF
MHTTPARRRQPLLALASGLGRKAQRFATSLLPVDAGRRGDCNRCGECCKLPYPCPFLRYDADGLSRCSVYHARPPSCRKYPRTASEHITPATCGYYFVNVTDLGRAQPATEQAGG